MIEIKDKQVLKATKNTFSTPALLPNQNIPIIYFNTSSIDNCMDFNTFEGFAIAVYSGTISSCYRYNLDKMIDQNDKKCWYTGLGSADTIYLFCFLKW